MNDNSKHLKQMRDDMEETQAIIKQLLEKYPDMSPITALIVAGDMTSAKRADEAVASGHPVLAAARHVGSYARFDWLAKHYLAGRLNDKWLFQNIMYEWVGSDPDDTDPRFLSMWKRAWAMNKRKYLYDASKLPTLSSDLKIYRGQGSYAEEMGIAWTIDESIATAFANGRGARAPRNGIVLSGTIKVENVIAYLTQRGESEIVCDPANVMLD